MWKWIKNLIIKLFSLDTFTPMLPPPAAEDANIKVTFVPKPDEKPKAVLPIDAPVQESFKKSIVQINQKINQDVEKSIERFFNVELPKAYELAYKLNMHDVCITSYNGFQGNNRLLNKAYPIIKAKLLELDIKNVRQPIKDSIFISTDEITRASNKWGWEKEELVVELKLPPKAKIKKKKSTLLGH